MKNLKKTLCLFLALVMCLGMLPVSAFAWNSSDTITINVRVYDQSTHSTYNVGTDSVQKGDQYIQSVAYRIPNLSQFTDKNYGRILKVVGNWYFPSHDSTVGANVEWSCNVSNVTMTYWVDSYNAAGSTTQPGSGSGPYYLQVVYVNNNRTAFTFGERKSMSTNHRIDYYNAKPSAPKGYRLEGWQTAHYHGTAYVQLQRGGILSKDWWPIFSGDNYPYTKGNSTQRLYVWSSSSDPINYYANLDGDPTLYLIYRATGTGEGGESKTPVTLTYMDGNTTYDTQSYFEGDSVVVTNNTKEKTEYTFEGWDTNPEANTAVYKPSDTFSITQNTTLYAVWQKNAEKVTLTYDASVPTTSITGTVPAAVTVTPGTQVTIADRGTMDRDTHNFRGWSTTKNSETVDYAPSAKLTLNANTTLYAVWGQYQSALKYHSNDGQNASLGGSGQSRKSNVHSYTAKALAAVSDQWGQGRTFLGWNTKADGTGTTYQPGADVSVTSTSFDSSKPTTMNLYAMWDNTASYTVQWFDTDGNVLKTPETRSGTVGNTVSVTDADKKVNGYTFKADANNVTEAILSANGTVLKLYFTKDTPNLPTLTIDKKVQLVKADGTLENVGTFVKTGSTVKYTITVENTSAVNATNVVITDVLPDGLKADADSITGGGSYGSRTVTWKLSTLAAGKTATVSFDAEVTASGDTEVENIAKVVSFEITTPVESDPVSFIGKDMSITTTKKQEGTITAANGVAVVPYKVTVTNNGDPLFGLDILDEMIEITVQNEQNKPLDNSNVSVTYDMDSFKLKNNATTATLENGVIKVVAINRGNSPDANFLSGEENTVTLTYNVLVKNLSSEKIIVGLKNKATGGSWVTPDSTRMKVKAAKDGGGYDVEGTATATASVGSATVVIPPAQNTVTVTVKYVDEAGNEVGKKETTVDKDTTYTVTDEDIGKNVPNGYERDTDKPLEGDPLTGTANVNKTITVPVKKTGGGETNTPDLDITKTVTSGSTVEPGGEVKYKILVSNNGGAADNVVITDVLNSNLEFVKAEGNGNIKVWDTEPEDGHYVIGSLAASNQQTGWFGYVEITAKVKAGTSNGTISNTAYVTCDDMTTPKPSNEVEVKVDDGTPTEYTITVKYVDEEGNAIAGYPAVTVDTTNGGEYDVSDKQVDIDGYTYQSADKGLTGTATEDTEITLTYKKDNTPDTGKVTITVVFEDEDGNAVKTVTEKVVKDTEYDVTADAAKLPAGYEANGDPTGADLTGIADEDKTITVPVKKTPVEPKEKVDIIINFVDEEDGTVVKTIVETVDKATAYDKTDEVENGIPAGYERVGELPENVTGTADDNVVITVPVTWADPDTPKPTETVTITVEFVDEDGNQVKSVTETVEAGTEYNVEEEVAKLPAGYEANGDLTGDPTTGTADVDKTITVPVKKSTEPEPEQVTITIKFMDGEDEIKTIVEKVDKGTKYDKNDEIENGIPKGYEVDGDLPENVTGTAGDDVVITVPVKKSGSGSGETEYVTVTWLNGYDGGQVGDTQQVTKGTTSVSRDLYPANPTRADYTFSGWSDPVTGADGNITITAQWTYNSGSSGSGSGNGGGSGNTPTPPVDIEDEDPPLANVDGNLNTTDHFAYIIGRGEDCVQPLENITRAEVATIFFRLLTEEYRVANWSTVSSFPDVEAGAWYSTEIATAEKAGILKGCDDGNMQPDRNITRAEFTVMAIRFLNGTIEDDGIGDFADTANHWAAKEIRLAAKAGWIKGYGNEFRPNDPITRAEAMTIINRMLDRVPGETFPAGTIEWGDNPTDAWYYADVMEATNGHDYEREEGSVVEKWTAITPYRDWIALEAEWTANNGASASAQ